jgi:uncharacterized MAPEG superfamily protein
MPRPMTIPLWCLIAFVLLTIGVVVLLSFARWRHLASGGSHREFGVPDERRLMWRAFRAHLNCLENLPLFASVVLVATVRGVVHPLLDLLAVIYLARVGQTTIHLSGRPGNVRFTFLVVQLLCLVGLAVLAVLPS